MHVFQERSSVALSWTRRLLLPSVYRGGKPGWHSHHSCSWEILRGFFLIYVFDSHFGFDSSSLQNDLSKPKTFPSLYNLDDFFGFLDRLSLFSMERVSFDFCEQSFWTFDWFCNAWRTLCMRLILILSSKQYSVHRTRGLKYQDFKNMLRKYPKLRNGEELLFWILHVPYKIMGMTCCSANVRQCCACSFVQHRR